MNNEPLVSVCVLAYNAAEYVIETLESIKAQTYNNIELIVSDDFSSDNTVHLCKIWLDENGSRFTRTELITVEENTGVTANCNRALDASTGKYWKCIGSDDLLTNDAVEKCVNFLENNPEKEFIFGNQYKFSGDFRTAEFNEDKLGFRFTCCNEKISAKQQLNFLTKIFFGCAPSSFSTTEVLKRVGGFDSRFPYQEDGPMYIKLTKHGVKLWYFDDFLVYRRVHSESIMHKKKTDALLLDVTVKSILNPSSAASYAMYENSSYIWKQCYKFLMFLNRKIIENGNSNKSTKALFYNWIRRLFSPYKFYVIYMLCRERISEKIHS